MNALDRAIAAVAPRWALNRAHARAGLQVFARAHEATRPGRLRRTARDHGSGNSITLTDTAALRREARHLERDHDICRGALNTLVQNTVGTGIDVDPLPRLPGQEVDEGMARQLTDLYDEWWEAPEVTRMYDVAGVQQQLARALFRDGESFYQGITGYVPSLEHGSSVPYSIELIEADLCPLDYNVPDRGIVQGIETNAWNRAVAYWLYKHHPGDQHNFRPLELKRLSADTVRHIALRDRFPQHRGISVFASVITRLEDIKDYEESERIAAKIAASLGAYIRKGVPADYGEAQSGATHYVPDGNCEQRHIRFSPGMVIDDLLPGEDIGMIDSKRPNPSVELFRSGQLRAAAAGLGTTFSSLAKNYNGTYSAQRQELVEQWGAYAMLGENFVAQCVRPMWREFVAAALLAGRIRMPRGWQFRHLVAASFIRPAMPWINPMHEANAFEVMERNAWMPGSEVVRRRGAVPHEVIDSERRWRRQLDEAGISTPATTNAADAAREESE